MMRVGGLSRLDHLHIACRQVVERVVGVVVLLLAVLSPVVATFGQLQVHHLSVMVMMHSHCYHCEHNGKADYDYGQSFVHSAAKVKILFHIYKYYKLFFMTRCLFSIVYVLRCLPQRGLSAAIRLLGRSAALSGHQCLFQRYCGAQWGVAFAVFAALRELLMCALSVSRFFEAQSPHSPASLARAALRLQGVRERSPLRGTCINQM